MSVYLRMFKSQIHKKVKQTHYILEQVVGFQEVEAISFQESRQKSL